MIKKFRVWDKLAQRYILPDKGYQGHYWIDLNGKFCNFQNGSGGGECVIEQFTGFKDWNGVDIYEGDVCKIWFKGWSGLLFSTVIVESIIGFGGLVGYKSWPSQLVEPKFSSNIERVDVVGNVNQKPETLTANNSFTNEEISKIRECFDYKGINYSEIQIEEKNCLYIHGGMWSNLKCARVSKRDGKYAIVWNCSNSLDIFNQVDISFDKVLNILKG